VKQVAYCHDVVLQQTDKHRVRKTSRMTPSDYDFMRSSEIFDGTLPKVSFVFDLDVTLLDSVYQHVLAWREALLAEGINLAVWRIHRKIGMCGRPLTNMLLRDRGYHIDAVAHQAAAQATRHRFQPLRNRHPALTWRLRTSCLSDSSQSPLGDCDQWTDGDRAAGPWSAAASAVTAASGRGSFLMPVKDAYGQIDPLHSADEPANLIGPRYTNTR
jgi:hypothetical protein